MAVSPAAGIAEAAAGAAPGTGTGLSRGPVSLSAAPGVPPGGSSPAARARLGSWGPAFPRAGRDSGAAAG